MNQTVATMAGALKDASRDGSPVSVVAPIFSHPQFERLEAEGVTRQGEKISAAARIISDVSRPPNS